MRRKVPAACPRRQRSTIWPRDLYPQAAKGIIPGLVTRLVSEDVTGADLLSDPFERLRDLTRPVREERRPACQLGELLQDATVAFGIIRIGQPHGVYHCLRAPRLRHDRLQLFVTRVVAAVTDENQNLSAARAH